MYKVVLVEAAKEFYVTCRSSDVKKINKAIEYLTLSPRFHPNIKPLKGSLVGLYRYRAGDLRLIYSIEDKKLIISIINIKPPSREVWVCGVIFSVRGPAQNRKSTR
jgi:mRNA interferase RelE/StbE